jgi:hypothetical protein
MGIRLESQPAFSSSSDCNSSGKSITVIKEICKDTLAEKDGRLRAGDRVLMVILFILNIVRSNFILIAFSLSRSS